MARKILQIIDTPYRCTIEEQDEPALWLTHVLAGLDAPQAVLLRGSAVNYAVRGQDASGLAFGGRPQTQPPRLDRDVAALLDKGVEVYYVRDDAAERGLEGTDLVAGLEPVARADVARLFDAFDQIWHW